MIKFCHVQNAPMMPKSLLPYLKYHGVPSSGWSAALGFDLFNNPIILSCEKKRKKILWKSQNEENQFLIINEIFNELESLTIMYVWLAGKNTNMRALLLLYREKDAAILFFQHTKKSFSFSLLPISLNIVKSRLLITVNCRRLNAIS
jgi:hypothetical protein